MTTELSQKVNGNGQEHQIDDATLLRVMSTGDMTGLNDSQRISVYRARCESAGLDYRAQPFQIIKMNGKEVLYALKAATDQLAAKHGVRCEIISQVTESGIRTVTVRSFSKDGRQTDEIGCVTVQGLSGDQLANAYMKATTKAKRRAVLSICGLGMLDETELETIPNTNAPAPLPLPRRKSETPEPKPEPKVIDVPKEPTPEEINEKLERAALQDEGKPQEPTPIEGAEECTVLKVSKKPTKQKRKDGTLGTSYGILVKLSANGQEIWVNTFDDNDAATGETAISMATTMLIRRKPRDFRGTIYWDLVGITPAVMS